MRKVDAAVNHADADGSERRRDGEKLPGAREIGALWSPLVRSIKGIVNLVDGLGGLLIGSGRIPCG